MPQAELQNTEYVAPDVAKQTLQCPLLQPRTAIVSELLVRCGKLVIYGLIKTGVRRICVVLESESIFIANHSQHRKNPS